MKWHDYLALVGYGFMLYVLLAAILEGLKAIAPEIEKAWANLIFHGNIRGEKRLRK